MTFDKSKFIDHFKSETREHIQNLSDGLLELEKEPGKKDVLESMMREAHTIKGSAMMMGYQKLADIAHGMEDGMEKTLKGEFSMGKSHFDLLFRCLDSMEPFLEEPPSLEGGRVEMPGVEEICREVEEVFAGKGLELVKKKREAATEDKVGVDVKGPGSHRKSSLDESIRVDINKLDRLMNLSGEFGIARLRLKEVVKILVGKAEKEKHLSGKMVSLLTELSGIDEHIGSLTSTLQTEMMEVRTVPISHLFNTFPRAMRELAAEMGKQVEFEIIGSETKLDKSIIDELRDPLMHLLRNAVDHGIEVPEDRRRLGKDVEGRIVLKASQKGSHVLIEISDDGRGIDMERVKAKAVEKGLMQNNEIGGMSDERAYKFLFTPNFTTADVVTDVSGRGVGLDVVKNRINELKGGVEIDSRPGEGTRFTITLPLTLAITESLLVVAGSEIYAIPMECVVETVRVRQEEIRTVGTREVITVRGQILPLLRLNKAFNLSMRGIIERRFFPVVHIQALNQKIGLLVDEIHGCQEIIRKSLRYPLKRIGLFSGVTILGDGRVTLILDVPSLLESIEGVSTKGSVGPPRSSPRMEKSAILLAEDSLSTATLEKEILESAGYSVVLARDGREALEKINQGDFDLIITDILMPRMDGFELTTRLKKNREYKDIPIIIVTTRESDEDKRRGLEAGADAYILKSEFTSEELLGRIDRLVG